MYLWVGTDQIWLLSFVLHFDSSVMHSVANDLTCLFLQMTHIFLKSTYKGITVSADVERRW